MKPLIVISSYKAHTPGGGRRELFLTVEGGESKSLSAWIKQFGLDRTVVYQAYIHYSLPSDKILKQDDRVPKPTVNIWSPGDGGSHPKVITKVIRVKNDNHRTETLVKCDNGFIYECFDLANIVGISLPALKQRGYKYGWTHKDVLAGKAKKGRRLDGTKITGQGKYEGEKNRGNAEFQSFTDKRRDNSFLRKNAPFDDIMCRDRAAGEGGAARYLGY